MFHSFVKPTLIAVTDSLHAKFFLAFDRSVNESGGVDMRGELAQTAKDRSSIRLSGGHGQSMTRSNDDQHEEWASHVTADHFYTALNKELMHRLQNQEFEALAVCVPEELKNELRDALHIDLLKRLETVVPKNLMHEDAIDIVAAVQETPQE